MRLVPVAAFALVLATPMLLVATPTPARAAEPSSTGERLPAFGEYVYVEEMPEAIQKGMPVYPPLARQAGVSGDVTVQALVGRDGTVRDTRVTHSVPMLDAAAMDAVRQWRFKPARSNGSPVACWVAIPVRFFLDGKPPKTPDNATPPTVRAPIDGPPRGPRTVTPEDLRTIPVQRYFEGTYFIDADSADRVIVTREKGGRVRLESPGQWRGRGTFDGRVYRGTFEYLRTAPDPRNRGARGTHVATAAPLGRMTVEGTFTNRPWPPFRVTWTPLFGDLHFRGGRTVEPRILQEGPDGPRGGLEPHREPGRIEHPVWPPESRSVPEHLIEHPVWPPEWFQGDLRIVPADGADLDTPPRPVWRAEPRWDVERARSEGIRDEVVVVRAMVEPNGSVSQVRIAKSVPMLDASALDAVRQWRFRAASKAGRPVRAEVYVPMRFLMRSLDRGLKP